MPLWMVGDANEYIEVNIAGWNMHTACLALSPYHLPERKVAGPSQDGMRVTTAADRLGFDSEASFSRAFKRVVGRAPSKARNAV